MLVVSPFKLLKLVIPHSKCDLISFLLLLLLYRWKNTQFVQRCDSQSTSSGVYFPTWLRSVNKEAVSETGLTYGAPPQTRISRISHTSLFEWSEVANASWLLTSFKILPHSLLVLQVNMENSGSTVVWHRRLPQFVGVTAAVRGGLLPADGTLKKIWPVGLGGGRDH